MGCCDAENHFSMQEDEPEAVLNEDEAKDEAIPPLSDETAAAAAVPAECQEGKYFSPLFSFILLKS